MFKNLPLDFLWTGTALYVLGFGYALRATMRNRDHGRPFFYVVIILGLLVQSAGLYKLGLETHSLPVGNAFELLQVMAWMLIFLKLILRATLKLRLLGLFASGLAATLGVISLFVPSAHQPAAGLTEPGNPWIGVHVAMAVFSYGVFGLLAVTAAMYLLQRHALDRKQFGGIYRRLPSLAELDALNRHLLLVGVWALTVAVALGVLDWYNQPGSVSASKLAVVVAVWAGYIIAGWLRWRNRLVARNYAWSCLALFCLALFSLWPVSTGGHDKTSGQSPTLPVAPNNSATHS